MLLSRMPQSEILEQLRVRVRTTLSEHGMPLPEDAIVLFDDSSGRVLVIDSPHVWEGEADRIANEVGGETLRTLYEAQKNVPARSGYVGPIRPNNRLMEWFFWGFNGVVLLYWCAWFVYFVFSPDFREWYTTAKSSSDFGVLGLVAFLLLPAIPVISVLTTRFATYGKIPEQSLVRSSLLFEVPVFTFAYVFNQVLAHMPLTNGLRILALVLACIFLCVWYVCMYRVEVTSVRARVTHSVVATLLVVAGIYLSLITIVPGYIAYFETIVPGVINNLIQNTGELLADPFFAMTMLLTFIVTLMPFVIYVIIVRKVFLWYRIILASVRAECPKFVRTMLVGTPAVFVGLLYLLSAQFSSNHYIDELVLLAQDTLGYESNAARARSLADRKVQVDRALERMLYADQMYVFDASNFENRRSYEPMITSLYLRFVAFPFIYDDTNGDSVTSVRRDVVLHGYRRAYGHSFGQDPEKVIAPLKQVQHTERDVHVLTHGSPMLAEVTVTDSFTSFASQDQEVVYEFSLPEHAVVTGLKLGPSLEHVGQIAPRGAAQQVYTEQVRATRDPALLEQTGPRQYRLRVYPIPGTSESADRTRREKVEGPTQRVQFTYTVMRDEKGIPLPVYSEEYNVLANETKISARIDGADAKFTASKAHVSDPREPSVLCALNASVDVTLAPGSDARLLVGSGATGDAPLCVGNDTAPLNGVASKKVAILLDTSYANGNGKLEKALDDLRALPDVFYAQNSVQLYLYSDTLGTARTITAASQVPEADDVVYFGRGNTARALEGMPMQYDAVLVIAGEKLWFNDDVAVSNRNVWFSENMRAPEDIPQIEDILRNLTDTSVIFAHPHDMIPAYPSTFETLLASACSIAVSDDFVHDLEKTLSSDTVACEPSYRGGYWRVEATPYSARADLVPASVTDLGAMDENVYDVYEQSGMVSTSLVFEEPEISMPAPVSELADTALTWDQRSLRAIVERSHTSTLSREVRRNSYEFYEQNRLFDALHERAKKLGIVTPLSSYIALVNAQQQARLDDLSSDYDRYTSEQRFVVTQPKGFTSPLGGGESIFSARRQDMSMSSSLDGGGGELEWYSADFKSSETSISGDGTGALLPRIFVLVFVLGAVCGGAFIAYRMMRKKKN